MVETKVLVVEASAPERSAIVAALSTLADVAVLGAVANMQCALSAIAKAQPDLLITGTVLGDASGGELVSAVRQQYSSPAVVMIDRDPSRERWLKHLADGADRVVDRDGDFAELRSIVQELSDVTRRASRQATRPRRIDLGDVVTRVLETTRRAIAFDRDDDAGPIFGVPAEVDELVSTVLKDANAVRVGRTSTHGAVLEAAMPGAFTVDEDGTIAELARRLRAAVEVARRDDGAVVLGVVFPPDLSGQ